MRCLLPQNGYALVAPLFDGALVTKAGPGGNLEKTQGEVYAAVGVRHVKKDTSSGRRDVADSDASSATSQSPCGSDNAGAASLWGEMCRAKMGKSLHRIMPQVAQGRKAQKMRSEKAPAPGSRRHQRPTAGDRWIA